MKKLLFAILLIFALLPANHANAHVFITDDSNQQGAVLHITPDDDPIAGDQSTLNLDTQKLNREIKKSTLTITDPRGATTDVSLDTNGTLHQAKYTFPTQGTYQLTFTLKTIDSSMTFSRSQRVTRGVASGALSRPNYTWARLGLLASGIEFLVLVILVTNRRHDIARQSVM